MKPVSQSPLAYRPDIDGLRALAVLAVLFFHADIGCPGGFVGVDIFFVISGFLISSLILQELNTGTFSLTNFWERRIRRILPAWGVVTLVSLATGWLLMLPPDFATLGQSVIAQTALLSNVFFWQQTTAGYFAASPDTMPLLHTWSLAIEEQFYILFPLLLFVPMRWRRITFVEIIICLWVASFVESWLGTARFPQMSFYLLPMRAWELLTGAVLAAGYTHLPANRTIREISGWLGLGLMLYAIFFFDRRTPFPGSAALIPCLGAFLFILSSKGTPCTVGRIFSFKPITFIGLISYSLYLWHWPLLAFASYLPIEELSLLYRLKLLVAALGLAIISWKLIETPIRSRRILKTRGQIFGMAAGCMITILLSGFLINSQHGWPNRLNAQARKYLDAGRNHPFWNEIQLYDQGTNWADSIVELGSQPTNQPIFLLICGDSHAMVITPMIDSLCRKYSRRGKQATLTITAPIVGYFRKEGFRQDQTSPSQADLIISFVARNHVQNVVLTARWSLYSDAHEFKTNLVVTVRRLVDSGAKVYLLEDVPKPGFDAARAGAEMAMAGRDINTLTFSSAKYEAERHNLEPAFEMARNSGAVLLDPSPYFAAPDNRYHAAKDGELLYWDDNHLTVEGSRALQPLFEPMFRAN